MRQFIAFLVLTALFVPTIPLVHAEDGDPVEEVLDSPAEITEELSEPEEEAEELPPPLDIPELEELETELEVPDEEPEIKEPEIPEEEIVPEDVFKVEEMQLFAVPAFHKTLAPVGDDEVVVYDFPTAVWGGPNGAFSNGSALSPYPPFGSTADDKGGEWDVVSRDFTRWMDLDTGYTFDRLDLYLVVTNLNVLDPYPLTSGAITIRIYEADDSWDKGNVYATSEPVDATTIAEGQTGTTCTGDGTSGNPFNDECITTFEFSEPVALDAGQRYVFEVVGEDIVSPTEFSNIVHRYFYPGLSILGASASISPFGNDGIQDAIASNTGAVYMRLIGPEPVVEPEMETVLFLPGFLASRLYTTDGRQLWEPNGSDDLRDLALVDGASQVPIYVGEVIDHGHPEGYPDLPLFSIHERFFEWLEDLKGAGRIADWKTYSYDWRYDIFDVLEDGTLREDDSRDYLVDVVTGLAEQGKVTIVAHSNGGLLAKALMIRLAELGREEIVNRIVFIGTPHVGTPQAMLGLLHGDSIYHPILTFSGTARASAITMPGAYALLPTEAYFNRPHSALASFAGGETTDLYRTVYGERLSDLVETVAFWTNTPFARSIPEERDEETPYPLSDSLLEKAQETHDLLNAWAPPAHLEMFSIAGWGNNTATGASYITECVLLFCSIDYRREIGVDGDDTVLASSALYQGSGVYFDLFELDNRFLEERKHQNLTESDFIHQYLENLFGLGTIYDERIFVTNEPSTDKLPAERSKILSVHSPVILAVTDSNGNQSGIFPLPDSDLYYVLEEIPDSSVELSGEDKYVSVPSDDEYQVTITGIGTGTFAFQIEEYEGDEQLSDSSIANLPVTNDTTAYLTIPEEGEMPAPLELDIDNDQVIDITVAFNKNEAIIYEEFVDLEEEPEENEDRRTRRKNVFEQFPTADEQPVAQEEMQFWPNPYLLPAAPFLPPAKRESTSTLDQREEEHHDIQQTASAYNALQASISWIMAIIASWLSWILNLFELR